MRKKMTSPNFKKTFKSLLLLLTFTVPAVLFILFTRSQYFPFFKDWASHHLVILFFLVLFIKTMGIVIPPIPGNLFTYFSVPFLGAPIAFALDFMGSTLGSTIAFFLTRKYGRKFISQMFGETILKKIDTIKIKKHKEVESLFMLRLFGGAFSDTICFAAGLMDIKFKDYIIAHMLCGIIAGIPMFFLINNVFQGKNLAFSLITGVISILVIYKLRGRYFE
jgi:uncharacterized membrane protein YdjX (TVP38/TMEM64 family)